MSAPQEKSPHENPDVNIDHSIAPELHEKLCAFVFGEMQGTERAAFEAELARDARLRAECERIESTAKLVKQALPEERLSDEIRATLRRAAERGPHREPVKRRFVLLRGGGLASLAAVAAALVVGVFVWRDAIQKTARYARSDKVAQAPAKEKAAVESGERRQRLEIARNEPAPESAPIEPPSFYLGREKSAQRAQAPVAREPVTAEEIGAGAAASVGETPAIAARRVGGGRKGRAAGPTPIERFEQPSAMLEVPSEGDGLEGGEGEYRGPGDTIAPGAVVGRIAAHAQSQELQLDAESLERLRGLGYVTQPEQDEETRMAHEPALREQRDGDQAANLFTDDILRAPDERSNRRALISPEELARKQDEVLELCRILPGETPSAMFFRCWGDHPFVSTREDPLSTFGIDVDTASYTLARSTLNYGVLPTKDQVRTEEFVNYFRADATPPSDGSVFAIGLEAAPSLFGGPGTEMLRVTVRGKEVAGFERQPLALTFVIDNSGSMADGGRLELVKDALRKLLGQLSPTDSVAVIVFSNRSRVLAPMTSAANRGSVEDLLAALGTEGGTNVEAGLMLGYEHAVTNLTPNAVNRVILCSDGVGNIGDTTAQALLAKIEASRKLGIYLNTIGVGMGNHNDDFLEQFADRGDGLCQYIDSVEEAERALVQRFTESLQPIARDVKIQVEFDPSQVESWRLLGYENRAIADEKFRDDAVDAGEVNAGHQVTALYEIQRSGGSSETPLATVSVRYKPPHAVDQGTTDEHARAEMEVATEVARSIDGGSVLADFRSTSAGYRRSVLVAEFAELLRRSVHARHDSRDRLLSEAKTLDSQLRESEFTEFVALVEKALPMLGKTEDETSSIQGLIDELCLLHYGAGQRELLEKKLTPEEEEAVQHRIEELERAIRESIAREYGIVEGVMDTHERLRELGYINDER